MVSASHDNNKMSSSAATFSVTVHAAGGIHRHVRHSSSNQLRSRVALVATRNSSNNSRRAERQLRAEAPDSSSSSSSFGEKKAGYGNVPRHNVAIGGHNPTGGDESMDEARVVCPYGLVRGRGGAS